MNLFTTGNKKVEQEVVSNFLEKCKVIRKPIKEEFQIKKNFNILDKVKDIEILNKKYLSKYDSELGIITNYKELEAYINQINKNGIYAIDTETDGLNCYENNIIGFSLYTPKQKAVYIPINHRDMLYLYRLKEQIEIKEIKELLDRITAKCIMFNARFDVKFIEFCIGTKLKVFWDCYIFQKIFYNGKFIEKGDNSLKAIYGRFKGIEGENFLSYSDYFEGISFELLSPKLVYKYAAMDAKMTYELYEIQSEIGHKEENLYLFDLFFNLEMPLLPVVLNMENCGIKLDTNYLLELKEKYEIELENIKKEIYNILDTYKEDIKLYRRLKLNDCKLSEPIALNSPTQIAILLYDIIKLQPIDIKKPRGTGEDILQKIDIPLTKKLLEYRELEKIYNTYIISLPNQVRKKLNNRITSEFNQVGTATGRFSSSNPNLQNLPARNKDIRKAFLADEGNYLISVDYKSQEPRIVALLSGDSLMIKAFNENYDFYSFLASQAYGKPYDECKEFYKDGTPNKSGGLLRFYSKTAFLGICYGSGAMTLSKTLGISIDKSKKLLELVLDTVRGVGRFQKETVEFAKKNGYVETLWGRRRYFKNINLPFYNVNIDKSKISLKGFNPFNFDENNDFSSYEEEIKEKWLKKLGKFRNYKEYRYIQEEARKEGVYISDNSNFIAEDERQAFNTRVQGTAADMLKIGMLNIGNSKELKELGFNLCLTVHDEIIGQCPKENLNKVLPLLRNCMLSHTRDFEVVFDCDFEISDKWYGEPVVI